MGVKLLERFLIQVRKTSALVIQPAEAVENYMHLNCLGHCAVGG